MTLPAQSVCGCNPPCGLPPCTMCGEDHGGNDVGGDLHLCRDCSIEYQLDGMHCSGCNRMRYREDDATGPLPGLAAALWGGRCVCPEPRPPSARELKAAKSAAP